jgi:3-oxoisoapionate decarboxylase
MRSFRVGIDNYPLFPLALSPLDTLRWAAAHGAEGVAFSGLPAGQQAALDDAALADLAAFARERGLYLEWGGAQHIPRDMTTWARKEIESVNRLAARQAVRLGVRVVRSCSGGLMRWTTDAPSTGTLLSEMAEALRAQRPMLLDHGVVLAIETHFEFTSHELLRVFEWCDAEPGGWLGICLDTMNLLTMLEDPVSATRRMLPWIVSTHIKDGGVLIDETGLTTFPAPLGRGAIDLRSILDLLGTLERDVHLSVEGHGGSFHLPIYEEVFLARFPDLTAAEFARLVEASCRTRADSACRPLARADWPAACETRTAGDLSTLRHIVGRTSASVVRQAHHALTESKGGVDAGLQTRPGESA